MSNPFLLDVKEYKRNINPIQQYIYQSTEYLMTMTGKSYEECSSFVRNSLQNGSITQTRNPNVTYLQRKENGDREELQCSLTDYLKESINEGEIIAPTLTTYLPPHVKKSILVDYVDDNIKARGKAKKEYFVAKSKKQNVLAAFKNGEQTNRKLANNALSGAHVSAFTPLYNKTAHSTLTSGCRVTSGYGNANNEKLMNGNRHYWSSNVVMNNIVSIVTNTNYDLLKSVMDKYGIKYLSSTDALNCIEYSTKLYWNNSLEFTKIKNYLDKLTPIQLSAFVYTGDMYHLMLHNPIFVKTFIKELSTKVTGNIDDAISVIKTLNEEYLNLGHQICSTETKGRGKDYEAFKDTTELKTLVLTTQHIDLVINKYADLIKCFWVSDNIPASVGYFPESIRRSALTSDTDSTIFTVQDWVIWYKGELSFDEEATAVAASVIFLASQSISHVLAKISANFGVEEKRLFKIAMKNEYKFDVFVPTQVAKHYYASVDVQEGNVFKDYDMEIKGVHLKSSNAPKNITKQAERLMRFVVDEVKAGRKLRIKQILKDIGDTERHIKDSILKGETTYFRLSSIKSADSYSGPPNQSPYSRYLFWQEVFSRRYGDAPLTPFDTIKIPTILDNNTALKAWIESIADPEIKAKLSNWIVINKKTSYPTIYLSTEVVNSIGIPSEIKSIIDTRRIIIDLCNIFYIILESLGIYLPVNTIVSDQY